MPAYFRRPHLRPRILLSHSRSFARDELRNPFASFEFPVVIPRGSHPFPSRTRKLSLAGPMILHGQLCGNVGRRRDKFEKGSDSNRSLFLFIALFLQLSPAVPRFPNPLRSATPPSLCAK